MDYPEVLYQLDENKYYLLLTWLSLLLAAIAGNTRVLRSLLYAGVLLIVLGGLVLLLTYPDGGMAAAILLIYAAIGAFGFFLLHFLYTQFRNRTRTIKLNIPIRVTLALCALFLLLLQCAGAYRFELADYMLRRTVRSGNVELFQAWRAGGDISENVWDAVAERPQGPETLALLESIMRGNLVYDDDADENNGWTILLKHPPSKERLECIQKIAERAAPPAFFLAAFYDQKDPETFKAAIPNKNFGNLLYELAESKRMDVIMAIWVLLKPDNTAEPAASVSTAASHPDPAKEARLKAFIREVMVTDFLSEPELLSSFLAAGADPNVLGQYEKTALMLALEERNEKAAELLIKAGAALDLKDEAGRTALFYAIMHNNEYIFSLLLQAGNDPSPLDNNGLTPLHLAAWVGNPNITKALLKAGAKVDGPAPDKTPSPLFFAVSGGGVDVLKLVLKKLGGKAPDMLRIADDEGQTALMRAVLGLDQEGICYILDGYRAPALKPISFGLSQKYEEPDNWRILQERKLQTVSLLLDAGASLQGRLNDGGTILHALLGWRDNSLTLKNSFDGYSIDYPDSRWFWCRDIVKSPAEEREYAETLQAVWSLIPPEELAKAPASLCAQVAFENICREKLAEFTSNK